MMGRMKPEEPNDAASGRATDDAAWRSSLIIGGLALSIPTMLFGPPALGYFLDEQFGTKPWFFGVLLVVGFLGTAVDVFVILKRTKQLN